METLSVADLKRPSGLCFVQDALFICDTGNRRVIKAQLATNTDDPRIIVEDTDQVCVLQQPQSLALLAPSTLLVSDQLAHCIYTIDTQNIYAKPRLLVG